MFFFSLTAFQLLHLQTVNYHLLSGARENQFSVQCKEPAIYLLALVLLIGEDAKDVHIHVTEATTVFP